MTAAEVNITLYLLCDHDLDGVRHDHCVDPDYTHGQRQLKPAQNLLP